MFSFFKKKNDAPVPGHLPFTTDIHSHILPGIDDGAPDISTSLELIKGLCSLGITNTIATPHIIGDLYRNNAQTINTALQLVRDACATAKIDIGITAAAEYMLDDYFLELLQKKEPLLTLQKNIILTEIPFTATPKNLPYLYEQITAAGYKPIMAHPERYHFYQRNLDAFFKLQEMGFLLQINILSFTGYYGKSAVKAAEFILDNNLAALVATDLHHAQHLTALHKPENREIFHRYLGDKEWNNFSAL
jgi:protein-tyrosine phosphatase